MRYIKLFEEMRIYSRDFPYEGHDLSIRERKILTDLVGERYLSMFKIKVDDHYYYIYFGSNFNMFDTFAELRDYVLSWYYIEKNKHKEYLELVRTSKLDPSFEHNIPIRWASNNGYKDIVTLLLNDERVRSKLTEEEICSYETY